MATDLTRVLVTGWPSFPDGEATAGDVLAMEAVRDELTSAGVECDLAWSPVLRPGALTLADADPARYSHLVFACGPLRGSPVEDLHRRYARCRRVAIGVSVIDAGDPAAAGFDAVLPRDAPGVSPAGDLAVCRSVRAGAGLPAADLPVAGVILVAGQAEYAGRTRHEQVGGTLDRWLRDGRCALIPLQTRLDPRDWRLCERPAQFEAIVRRLDLVITTRLHGLVLALSHGVPALAIDPVADGAKVAAQARAWDWPAVITTGRDADLDPRDLSHWRDWCLSAAGRERAAAAAAAPPATPLGGLLAALRPVSAADAG